MKITEISVTYYRRVQIKQYEPGEAGVTLTATLEPGEAPKQAMDEMFRIARERVFVELDTDFKIHADLKRKFYGD